MLLACLKVLLGTRWAPCARFSWRTHVGGRMTMSVKCNAYLLIVEDCHGGCGGIGFGLPKLLTGMQSLC